jgi:hypothetical protein
LPCSGEQQLTIHTQFAELVDEDGEPPAAGLRQQMPHEAGFPRTEKSVMTVAGIRCIGSAFLQEQRQAGGDKDDAIGECR